MNRIVVVILALFCMQLQVKAQILSEAEVVAKMTQAFELNKANKHAEALELFLLVGENTIQQRSEAERQVYVCSQTMACMCYESLKQYKDGYMLAKKLLQGKLNDEEQDDIGYLYAMNGYFYACDFIQSDGSERVDYGRCREIISEILPYADERLKDYALPKIPLSWYFEGVQCAMNQRYDEALALYGKALRGYHELGKVSEEIDVLKGMASAKNFLCEFDEAKQLYSQALDLARLEGLETKQMDVLTQMWSLSYTLGDMKLIRFTSASMDSLMKVSGNVKTKFAYYHQKGDEAKSNGQYKLAERWYVKAKNLAEETNQDQFAANKHLAYAKLRDLYVTTKQYDEAVVYGRKAIEEYQKQFFPDDAKYYLPYSLLADIYRLKGDKKNCFACIDSLFLNERKLKEPKERCHMYMTRASCHSMRTAKPSLTIKKRMRFYRPNILRWKRTE